MNIFVFTQYDKDSLSFYFQADSKNILSTKFSKQLNIFYLNNILNYKTKFRNIFFSVDEIYNSTLIKVQDKSIKDEQYFKFLSGYNFSDVFSLGLAANNNILSDSRKIEINSASVSNIFLYGKYNPFENSYFASSIGYSNNRQIGENNFGLIYGIEGLINQFKLSEMEIYSSFRFRNEDISPRKNTLRDAKLSFSNNFNPDIRNTISLNFNEFRKDFFYQADTITAADFLIKNNIQSRTENFYFLEENFYYKNIIENVSLNLIGTIFWRTVNRDTRYKSLNIKSSSLFDSKINELKFDFEQNLFYKSSFINGIFKIIYSERNETHSVNNIEGTNPIFYDQRVEQENLKNNYAQRFLLLTSVSFLVSDNDKIYFNFLQNKLKYDTQSKNNFDDRDEILTIIRLRYVRKINPFFDFISSAEGNLNHIVYIFSQKSSNNNLNRVIKLNLGGNYTGKNFISYNGFEVSANYTVYDFEDLNPNYKSYSYRQFSINDSSTFSISNKIYFKFVGYLKLSEQAELKWQNFTTKPKRFLEEIFYHPQIFYTYQNFLFGLGFRHFSLKTFNYQKENKIIDEYYSSNGPSTEISINIFKRLNISLIGFYEVIEQQTNQIYELTNLSFEINWLF